MLPNDAVPPLSRRFCFELPAQPRSGEQALLGTRFQRPEQKMNKIMKTAFGRENEQFLSTFVGLKKNCIEKKSKLNPKFDSLSLGALILMKQGK
ncbi:MAG: hypothetical protein IPK50_06385 [Fibrobacterota bacterium]|nr:MAG: hypothetical protein IPK50_06385 [Fibrobacterota bacterium]